MESSTAHITDIYSLAVTPGYIVAASGASALKVWSISEAEYPLKQKLEAHSLGCHHVVASKDGKRLASAGFDGQCIIWALSDGKLIEEHRIKGVFSSRQSECTDFK